VFQFRLRPVDEIEPWGPPPSLHYFGLTDGCYWIQVGRDELFRYTPEVLACWKAEAAEQGKTLETFGEPYDAYQVMRLEADLADVLPHALEPVPPDIAAHIDTVHEWRRTTGASPVPEAVLRAFAAKDGRGFSDAEEMLFAATGWWGDRQMPVMHLRFSPVIHIWSQGEEVEVRWDNRSHRYKGLPVWTAEFGAYKLPRAAFLEAVRDFRQRFVEQMGERVQSICRNWTRPNIAIDRDQLRQEQDEMERTLLPSSSFATAETDWDAVRRVVKRISEDDTGA